MSAQETSEPQVEAGGTAGRLRAGREAAGLTLAQVSEMTKINTRHLEALEAGDFAALPGRSYALGFARTYARAVGLDEQAVLAAMRADYAGSMPQVEAPVTQTFVPGDPARVPSAGFAWVAGIIALIVAVGGYVWWQNYYRPSVELPSLLPPETPAPTAQPTVARPAAPAPKPATPSGPVVFTAQGDSVWVRFYDGTSKKTLLEKALTRGETFTVPDVADPRLWTGHPESLDITIGGQAIPRLAEAMKTMKDVPVTAAALLARNAPPAPGATATPSVDNAQHPARAHKPRPRHKTGGETVTAGGVLPAGVPLVSPSPAASGGNP